MKVNQTSQKSMAKSHKEVRSRDLFSSKRNPLSLWSAKQGFNSGKLCPSLKKSALKAKPSVLITSMSQTNSSRQSRQLRVIRSLQMRSFTRLELILMVTSKPVKFIKFLQAKSENGQGVKRKSSRIYLRRI